MQELMDTETGEVVTALIRPDSWSGAATRGLEARKEREAIVKEILREGHDFGVVPGCGDKPALLKPGAEKIADALNLYPDYEELDKIQDFVNRVWFYRYRCRLRMRGSDVVLSTGIGSCNSEAAKYKFRDAQRTCPHCGKAAIIKGKEEYGGGWLCFARKGGCGAKFSDNDPQIVAQSVGQVENPDIASVVNTVDKMAQKSSFVAACLNLGFSEQFTQDIDDNPSAFTRDEKRPDQPHAATDSKNCPECNGPTWDNRTSKRNPKAPDFKCKNKGCDGAIWLTSDRNATANEATDKALRDNLFDQAEKLLSSLPEDKRKEALGRLVALDTDTMAKKVAELSETARAKHSGKDDPRKAGIIKRVRDEYAEDTINEALDRLFEGRYIESLSLKELEDLQSDMIPF